jgi:hypothetical protein
MKRDQFERKINIDDNGPGRIKDGRFSHEGCLMANDYEIVKLSPASPEVYEQLGSKSKFWLRLEVDPKP